MCVTRVRVLPFWTLSSKFCTASESSAPIVASTPRQHRVEDSDFYAVEESSGRHHCGDQNASSQITGRATPFIAMHLRFDLPIDKAGRLLKDAAAVCCGFYAG